METIRSICALDSVQVGLSMIAITCNVDCCYEDLVPRGLSDKNWKKPSVHKLIARARLQRKKLVAYSGASASAVAKIVSRAEARASSLAEH